MIQCVFCKARYEIPETVTVSEGWFVFVPDYRREPVNFCPPCAKALRHKIISETIQRITDLVTKEDS